MHILFSECTHGTTVIQWNIIIATAVVSSPLFYTERLATKSTDRN